MPAVTRDQIELRSVGTGFVVTALAILCQLVAFFSVGLLVERFLEATGPITTFLLGDVVVRGLTSGLVAVAFLAWQGSGRDYVGVARPDRRDVLWILGVGCLVAVVVSGGALVVIASDLFSYLYVFDGFGFLSSDPILLAVPLSVLVVGPGIELLFRGVIQSKLRDGLGPAPAILGSSLLLMFVWRITWLGDPQNLVMWLIPGGLLVFVPLLLVGIAYERTDNVVVPGVLHGVHLSALYVTTTLINPFHLF